MLSHHNMLGPPVDHIWTSQCTCAVEAKKNGIKWTKVGKNGQKWAKMGILVKTGDLKN